jgi:hypothetical protein
MVGRSGQRCHGRAGLGTAALVINEDSITPESVDDPVWRLRWLMFLSYLLVLGCLLVMYLELRPGWRWSGFWWCFGSSCGGAVGMGVLHRRLLGRVDMPEGQRVKVRHRQLMNPWGWLVSGTSAGAMSAMIGTNVIGYILAIYVVVNAALSPWAYRAARRRWETTLDQSG